MHLLRRFNGWQRIWFVLTIVAVWNVEGAAIPEIASTAATDDAPVQPPPTFSEALAAEVRPFGVKVLALCPGSTKTNFHAAANMDRILNVKGQQTAEQVVETALRAVKRGRTRIVSGFTNDLVSRIVNFVPNSLITRVMAKGLRDKYQEDR